MTRLTRKFSEVVEEVRIELETMGVTQEHLTSYRQRVDGNGFKFPIGTHFIALDTLYLDYEVQRAAIAKHILNIIKNFDPRLCGPASACKVKGEEHITLYDGQQRSVAMALLGYTEVPGTTVETTDPAFPSYAFEMLNEKGIVKLTPGDMHRNALTRYRLGSREERNVRARTMQNQFDNNGIDLEDKNTRNSTRRGSNDYFFSHFKYAYKGIDIDNSGKTLNNILNAITTVFPMQEEIDQGVYIGLYEIARLDQNHNELPDNWMIDVLKTVKGTFKSSSLVHSKSRMQQGHALPGASWSAPSMMSNFMREVYIINGGTINLPYHGEGATMHVTNNPAPGLFPMEMA